MFQKRALVIGVTGIVGLNIAEHLLRAGDWEIVGVSRRPPVGLSGVKSIRLDVLDPSATKTALADLHPTTSSSAPGRGAAMKRRTSASTAQCSPTSSMRWSEGARSVTSPW
jgi:nucleoside-diphosphate-sugar epimerase